MDETDRKIIGLLKNHARMTSSEISKRVQLSIPAVSERIRKLEETGIINKYTLMLNRSKMNLELMAFIFVNVETPHITTFREKMIQCSEVLECHHMAGEYDYLLKVVVRNTTELEKFITDTIKKDVLVSKTNTQIVLSTLKEEF